MFGEGFSLLDVINNIYWSDIIHWNVFEEKFNNIVTPFGLFNVETILK